MAASGRSETFKPSIKVIFNVRYLICSSRLICPNILFWQGNLDHHL